jgi:hypothetical protein
MGCVFCMDKTSSHFIREHGMSPSNVSIVCGHTGARQSMKGRMWNAKERRFI